MVVCTLPARAASEGVWCLVFGRSLQYLGVLAWLQKRIAKRFEVCGIEVARLARIVFIGLWRQKYGREDCEPVAGQRYGEQEDY